MSTTSAKKKLDCLYEEVQSIILSRQNPITGLLPASTAINAHGNYTDAWVRDNVYSIISPWALSMAYRKIGDTTKSDELEQATIKLMRGLLQSMMRQANKVEAFKHSLSPLDSLHAKYNTNSGLTVVADNAWGHLQLDATSLFLLMLAQMTASGLRIIKVYSEVDFVQNLIYYIASAFRTPDYGIWERGNKINNGKTEINASSLGMAKAALQALEGLNLFGKQGAPRALVHSLPDALSLARANLASLLPRESLSKEVDSALLSIIGFPAFAVGDRKLVTRTRDVILKKLGGKYGLKRFLWDGHQTAIEDPTRLYYEHSELANFEHIESEWPLFFCYLYINALFDGNDSIAQHYREKIESIMVEKEGMRLLPELYYVPRENVAAERLAPHSQTRLPNENLPLVWAQSLYYTAKLLDEGLLDTNDLDACELRSNTTQFVRAQVALVVLAENSYVKATLAKNGVIAESIDDIFPLRVISAPHLVEAYGLVGANDQLGLTGRPKRRLLSLATSQTYNINDQKCLCLSWIQGDQIDDYGLRDVELVTQMVHKEISHIRENWLSSEVAVFTFMVNDDICRSSNAHTLFSCLQNFQLRTADENIGYASANLAYLASRENYLNIPSLCMAPLQSREQKISKTHLWNEEVKALLSRLNGSQTEQAEIISTFFQYRELSATASIGDTAYTYKECLNILYNQAIENEHWLITRLCFALSKRSKNDLADYLSVLSSRHFSVIVGNKRTQEFGLHPALTNNEIVEVLYDASATPIEHAILQEILEYIGVLQRTQPEIFEGLRSIQLHNLLRLCVKRTPKQPHAKTVLAVAELSPYALMNKLSHIFNTTHTQLSATLHEETSTLTKSPDQPEFNAVNMDWLEWRYERGLILNLNRTFLEQVWQSLSLTPQLIFGDEKNPHCVIKSDFVRNSMTPGEEIFAQLIDNALAQLHPPYFKTAMVEALTVLNDFHERYPNAKFSEPINLETVLELSANAYCDEERQSTPSTRNIDLLLEESPELLAQHLNQVLTNKAQSLD